MIFPVHRTNDLPHTTGKNLRRVDYFVYKMYRMLNGYYTKGPLTEAGVYNVIFYNTSDQVSYNDNLHLLDDNYSTCLSSTTLYSSSGTTEWMDGGSTPSYEIDGLEGGSTIPAQSFGFTSMTAEDILGINIPPQIILKIRGVLQVGETVTVSAEDSIPGTYPIASYAWYSVEGNLLGVDSKIELRSVVAKTVDYCLVVTDGNGEMYAKSFSITYSKPPKKSFWCRWFPWLNICK
jgi:hypothetical protein